MFLAKLIILHFILSFKVSFVFADQNQNSQSLPHVVFGITSPINLRLSELAIEYKIRCDQAYVWMSNPRSEFDCDFVTSWLEMDEIEVWLQKQVELSSPHSNELYLADIIIDKNWDDFYLKTIMWSYSTSFPTVDYSKAKLVVDKIIRWSFLRKKISLILASETMRKSLSIFKGIDHASLNVEFALLRTKLDSNFSLHQMWLFSDQYMNCKEVTGCADTLANLNFKTCEIAKSYKSRAENIIKAYDEKSSFTSNKKNQIFSALQIKFDIENELTKAISQYSIHKQDFELDNRNLVNSIIDAASVESINQSFRDEIKKLDFLFQLLDVETKCALKMNANDLNKLDTNLAIKVNPFFSNIEEEVKNILGYFEKKFSLILEEMY